MEYTMPPLQLDLDESAILDPAELLRCVGPCKDISKEIKSFISSSSRQSIHASWASVPVSAMASISNQMRTGECTVLPLEPLLVTFEKLEQVFKQAEITCKDTSRKQQLGRELIQTLGQTRSGVENLKLKQVGAQPLITLVCACHLLIGMSLQFKQSKTAETALKGRGQSTKQGEGVGRPGLRASEWCQLLQHISKCFSVLFPIILQTNDSRSCDSLLSIAMQACLLSAENAYAAKAPPTTVTTHVLPILVRCIDINAVKRDEGPGATNWTFSQSIQQLCDHLVSKGQPDLQSLLAAVLSESDAHAPASNVCTGRLAALCLELHLRISRGLQGPKALRSVAANGQDRTHETSMLLRQAASLPPSLALIIAPPATLRACLIDPVVAIRKDAIACIQAVLVQLVTVQVAGSCQTTAKVACVPATRIHQSGNPPVLPLVWSTSCHPMQALETVSRRDSGNPGAPVPGARADDAHVSSPHAGYLSAWMCSQLVSAARHGKDASFRKLACSAATQTVLAIVEGSDTKGQPSWHALCAANVITALEAAVKDSSKIVRAEAMKGCASVCEAVRRIGSSMQAATQAEAARDLVRCKADIWVRHWPLVCLCGLAS
jgi:hypothetical protein